MKKELFMNGVSIAMVNKDENTYWIEDEEWEVYKGVSRQEFIEYLKKISYTCLTTWDRQLKYDYLELVDMVKEMK